MATAAETDGFSIAQFNAEFVALQGRPFVLQLDGPEAFALLGQIQLACRHPANKGPSRQIAERIGRLIQATLATTPALAAVAEYGWNPVYDEEP
jgi:hypothetical protein